ncbi:MAG: hypothetical protein ACRDLL_07825 [Solirubrobacterales bacterium]
MSALAFDNSPLSHFARAGHLELLRELTAEHSCVVVGEVMTEIVAGIQRHPSLEAIVHADWLDEVAIGGEAGADLGELSLFATYAERLVSGTRNVGEAATLAWAESNAATAVVDDQAGFRAGKERGVTVIRSMRLITGAISSKLLTEAAACNLIDDLLATEQFLPCDGAGFISWAIQEGLLEEPK